VQFALQPHGNRRHSCRSGCPHTYALCTRVAGALGARVSAWYREDGGYVNRIDPFSGATIDANANRSANKAVRIGLAYEPNDAVRVTPSFSFQTMNLHDTPAFYAEPPPSQLSLAVAYNTSGG